MTGSTEPVDVVGPLSGDHTIISEGVVIAGHPKGIEQVRSSLKRLDKGSKST
jgi:hypothetical protein